MEQRSGRDSRDHHVAATRRAATAVLLGGPLWIVYGPLTMLRPWGADVAYSDAKGYSVIVDVSLFLVYSLPGALALVLTAVGFLGIIMRLHRRAGAVETVTRGLTYLAFGLGLISLVGVVILFDPVFTAGRIFGTLSLGGAALLASVAAWRGGAASAGVWALFLMGALGVLLLPLWPLVYALGWISEEIGAMVIALFGICSMWLAWRLWTNADGLASSAT
jgi:hypothetical protein